MTSKGLVIAVSIYQYSMSTLTTILLLILPTMQSRQYFDSLFVDVFARCILWIYFVGSYWTISIALKKGLTKKSNPLFLSRRNATSFFLIGASAVISGIFISVLTNWSIPAFVPQFPKLLISIVSVANGAVYGLLVLTQYCFLPAE